LVTGKLRRNSGSINAAIGRHRVHRTKMAIAREGGREARTDFQVIRSGVAATLLKCRLHSGRTHQIRVHLQHLGHPIVGDREYGGARAGNLPRPMLHAWKLAFDHPRTKARMHFEADVPADFESAMRELLPLLDSFRNNICRPSITIANTTGKIIIPRSHGSAWHGNSMAKSPR